MFRAKAPMSCFIPVNTARTGNTLAIFHVTLRPIPVTMAGILTRISPKNPTDV
jgi:hypothetical protein